MELSKTGDCRPALGLLEPRAIENALEHSEGRLWLVLL